ERGGRFLEIGWGFDLRGAKLDPPRFVIQMDAQDLARIARCQVRCFRLSNPPTVAEQQCVSFRPDPFRLSFVQNPAPFRSWPVEYTHSYLSLPLSPSGRKHINVVGIYHSGNLPTIHVI